MQSILSQSIIAFVLISITMLVTDFVCSVRHTPQLQSIIESPIVTPVTSVSYATLDWVVKVDDEESQSVDVVAIARIRQPQVDLTPLHNLKFKPATTATIDISSLGIRELKKLASERKLKGYSNMRKAELIAALF